MNNRIWLGLTLGSRRAILGLTSDPQQHILQNYCSLWTIPFQFSPLCFAKLVAWGASSLLPNSVRVANFSMLWSRCLGEFRRSFEVFTGEKRGCSGSQTHLHQYSPVIFGHLSWGMYFCFTKEFTFDTNFWLTIIWHQLYMICLRVVLQHRTISDTNFFWTLQAGTFNEHTAAQLFKQIMFGA